jgi:hypothetical protein
MKKLLLSFLSGFIVALFLMGIFSVTKAQSSVWFCKQTGAFGYAYGYDYNTTYDKGYEACIEFGGADPVLVLSTEVKGYGAIAISEDEDGNRVIGASAGFTTMDEAEKQAEEECKKSGGLNIYIYESWFDEGDDD